MGGWMGGRMIRWIGGWNYRRMNEWVDGWINAWMDR